MIDELKQYEDFLDIKIPDEFFRVIRLDGRGFHRVLSEYEKPFDEVFHSCMESTVKYLMKHSGFNILLGYTQSDEISLLFSCMDDTFNRRLQKTVSVLAGLTSTHLSRLMFLNEISFDARIILLPNDRIVSDYFISRWADSKRNALNGLAYWTLKKTGVKNPTKILNGLKSPELNDILMGHGENITDHPEEFRYGTLVTWAYKGVKGYNPKTEEHPIALRKVIVCQSPVDDTELRETIYHNIEGDV